MNEEKIQYYKKLQNFDKVLIEIEKTFEEVSKNQHQRVEELRSREIDL